MGISDTHFDPAFRYESLAREAFGNCGKWGDPWGYAAQDVYNVFVEEPTPFRGKRILITILSKLIFDYKGGAIVVKLKEQEDKIENLTAQVEVIELIDSTIKLLRSLDESEVEPDETEEA